jgi:hypothetical protein
MQGRGMFSAGAPDMISSSSALPVVVTLRQPDVDSLVLDLRRLYVGTGVQLTVDMGRVIIERLFGGDLQRWKSRSRKDVSFRKLETHPDLPFRASVLSRAVAMYMLSRRRGDLTGPAQGPQPDSELDALNLDDARALLEAATAALQHIDVLAAKLRNRIRDLESRRRKSDRPRNVPAPQPFKHVS